MSRDPLRYFRVEARELVLQLSQAVLRIEKGESVPEAVAQALRLAHTLKGAARVVRQTDLAHLAHSLEDQLTPLRQSPVAATRAQVDAMLASIDAMESQVAALAPPPASGSETLSASAGPVSEASATTAMALLPPTESLGVMEGLREAAIESKNLRSAIDGLDPVRRLTASLREQLASGREAGDLGAWARAGRTAEDLADAVRAVDRQLAGGVERLERELEQVRELAEQQSLLPANSAFPALERVVRDTAQAVGRRADCLTKGGEIRLESAVLGPVIAALVQLVRNAVAHGIEPERVRLAAGEPASGTVTIEVERRAARVRFVCRDDGRGIDLDEVRRAAQRRGLLPESSAHPADAASSCPCSSEVG